MELKINVSFENIFHSDNELLNEIPVLDANVTYNDFFVNFLIKNRPCLIKNVANKWTCSKLWLKESKPNFAYLECTYGDCDVTIYDCKLKYFNSQKTHICTFKNYLKYWQQFINSDYSDDLPLHYLKDWHLKNQCPEDNFYEVPSYFGSDWLNEYFVENGLDDYQFVYMGPQNTWTPFHADVFRSYSWSVNVCGQKKWVLVPPGEETYLQDSLGNLLYDITKTDHNGKCYEIIQNQGDAIFIPTGWYHQVWNLKNTISINHNWVNGCNLKSMWLFIEKSLIAVKNEINDCKEMDNFVDHCQVMLEATIGIDFIKFFNFIDYIAKKRIELLEGGTIKMYNKWNISTSHAIFDLNAIKDTLLLFVEHVDINKISTLKGRKPDDLLSRINIILSSYTC